jgi:hypothetical protein
VILPLNVRPESRPTTVQRTRHQLWQKTPKPANIPDGKSESDSTRVIDSCLILLKRLQPAADRKIIKNGELTLEVSSPNDAQRSVASIAESVGGFVVTSETKANRESRSF